MEVSNKASKVLFMVHLLLVTIGMLGFWSGDVYFLYNLLIFLLILWGIIDRASEEPYFMLFYVELLSVLFDVLVMIAASPRFSHSFVSILSVVLNMVFRLFALLTSARVHAERLGRPDTEKWALLGIGRAEQTIRRHMDTGLSFGGGGGMGAQTHSDYEDVDRSATAATTGAGAFRADSIYDLPPQPPVYSQVHKPPSQQQQNT